MNAKTAISKRHNLTIITNSAIIRRRITISGTVQGVGMRPHIYKLAKSLGLAGTVKNAGGNVVVDIQGDKPDIDLFIKKMKNSPPKISIIQNMFAEKLTVDLSAKGFTIIDSDDNYVSQPSMTPDMRICEDCEKELRQLANRRQNYPFISCTKCGPRYSLQYNAPYDRKNTSMNVFDMCDKCQEEYNDPLSNRFNSEINSCDICGPVVHFKAGINSAGKIGKDAIREAAQLIVNEKIVAIKGTGGFHLACLASSKKAVSRLREIKHRQSKPFAVLVKDMDQAKQIAYINQKETEILKSKESPIVLLRKNGGDLIDETVAPKLNTLGVMLCGNPLQLLIMEEIGQPIVLTSGNLKSEPLIYSDEQAADKLGTLVNGVLSYNRDIVNPVDDSVALVVDNQIVSVRSARGYAPNQIELAFYAKPSLAIGADIKNTFCLLNKNKAVMAPYIGDLESLKNIERLQTILRKYLEIYEVYPQYVVSDLHPDYTSTLYADSLGLQRIGVQHHFAHVVSCMVEHGLKDDVIGVAFDGTGYGDDGNLWGSEFLIANLEGYKRSAHFLNVPMAGGDMATKNPYRMALSYLFEMFKENYFYLSGMLFSEKESSEAGLISAQITARINSPLTSSCGRLFDAISAMLGLVNDVTYEGEAAAILESVAAPRNTNHDYYALPLVNSGKELVIDTRPLIRSVISDIFKKEKNNIISLKFHRSIANTIVNTCSTLRRGYGINDVVLTGGVFQNRLLLELAAKELENQSFNVYFNNLIPINDGGIALGQAVAGHFINQRMTLGKEKSYYEKRQCA